MFRDHESRYLVLSVVIAQVVIGWVLWYEIAIEDADSLPATITAIGYGVSAAVAIAILTLGTWEVIMVIARRLREREAERIRQAEEDRWVAWLERMRAAQREGRAFDEPAPSERRNGKG